MAFLLDNSKQGITLTTQPLWIGNEINNYFSIAILSKLIFLTISSFQFKGELNNRAYLTLALSLSVTKLRVLLSTNYKVNQ